MSTLSNRIATVQQVNPPLVEKGRYNAPITTPLVRIAIYPGTITYEDNLVPLIAPDGAPIAATGPGTWGQLYAAGRT